MFEGLHLTNESITRLTLLLHDLFGFFTFNIFYRLRGQIIESSEGFSLKMIGLNGIIYSDSEKRVYVYCEMAGGHGYFLRIAKKSMQKWETYRLCSAISEEERSEIASNIQELFRSKGLKIYVN
jgi:hypothetical protein